MSDKKLLLTAVFGPYGIKNEYAEAIGMQMELRNNNITREQGVHSPREDALSYCLYLLAENISIPCTVLDFPSWKGFCDELKKGYTHVGISFIAPNVDKVKRMYKYMVENHPEITIILGGYGTMIPEIEDYFPKAEISYGEGIKWFREYFNEDVEAPIVHPVMDAHTYEYIYGKKTRPSYSVILTAVGCNKACDFCCTTHKFDRHYLPILKSGKEIYDICCQMEQQKGYRGFSIMDENFLLDPSIAKQLLAEMENHNKHFSYFIFASADAIKKLGVDFLVRMGVRVVWIGVESKRATYHKLRGIDPAEIIREIQAKGITVIASGILFFDHHDEKTIYEEIDWIISLGADMVQFMNLTACPNTGLFHKMKKEGRITLESYRYHSGENELGFTHPHFHKKEDFINMNRYAFRRNYEKTGPSLLNMAITAVKGFRNVKEEYEERQRKNIYWDQKSFSYVQGEQPAAPDTYIEKRIMILQKIARNLRVFLWPAYVFSPNKESRNKAQEAMKLYNEILGKPNMKTIKGSLIMLLCASKESFLIFIHKLMGKEFLRQPPMIRQYYRQS